MAKRNKSKFNHKVKIWTDGRIVASGDNLRKVLGDYAKIHKMKEVRIQKSDIHDYPFTSFYFGDGAHCEFKFDNQGDAYKFVNDQRSWGIAEHHEYGLPRFPSGCIRYTDRQTKFIYWIVIQGNFGYGHGWEDLDHIDKSQNKPVAYARQQMKEHRLSCPSVHYRMINRRELRNR